MWPSDVSPNRFPLESVCWSDPPALWPVALGTPPHRQGSPTYKRGDGERREDPGVRGELTRKMTFAPTPRRGCEGKRPPHPWRTRQGQDPAGPEVHSAQTLTRPGEPDAVRAAQSQRAYLPARALWGHGADHGERGALWARWLSFAFKPRSTGDQGRQGHMRITPQGCLWETEGQVGSSARASLRD